MTSQDFRTFLKLFYPASQDARLELSEANLSLYGELAFRYKIWPLYYSQLNYHADNQGLSAPIENYLSSKKNTFLSYAAKSLLQSQAQENLLQLMRQRGIPVVIFKGTVLAGGVYKDLDARYSCDIDILIRVSDIGKVKAALESKGYRFAHFESIDFIKDRLHHAQFHQEESGTVVEAHWNFSIPGFFNLAPEQIWHHVHSEKDGCSHLTPEMTIVMLLMHHHLHGFKALRNIIDILWAVHFYDSLVDWHKVKGLLINIGLAKTTLLSIHQIHRLWENRSRNLDGLNYLEKAMSDCVRIPGFVIDYVTSVLAEGDAALTVKDKILYRLALDDGRNIALSFTKTLFPAPQVIANRYGKSNVCCLIANYVRFIMWQLRNMFNLKRF